MCQSAKRTLCMLAEAQLLKLATPAAVADDATGVIAGTQHAAMLV